MNNIVFYRKSFITFTKIGIFTLGGGYAMIPLIEREVVERHKWIGRDEMLDIIAVAQSCPGVFAVNISIMIGHKICGVRGAAVTAFSTALPSFVIILLIALFFRQFADNPTVAAVFRGIRPAVVALIAVPTYNMAKRAKVNLRNCWLPIGSALLICLFGISPVFVILAAVAAGLFASKLQKGK